MSRKPAAYHKQWDRLRLYGPLLYTLFLLLFFYSMLFTSLYVAFECLLINLCYSILAWETGRFAAFCARRRAPGINQTQKRLKLIVLYGVPLSLIAGFASQLFSLAIGYFKKLTVWDYAFLEGINLMFAIITISVYEGLYYIENWKTLFAESEEIKKINLNSQYDFLKDHIKPHFLFNSLNTLSSLISSNPVKAELFVGEMATVYRYLLKKNDSDLATLCEELSFLEAYLAMLHIRFEDSLHIELEIEDKYHQYLLPPFVLQLLVENAVKHNIVSRSQPLTIRITTDTHGNIHVYNNLQKRTGVLSSEKTGLSNLFERYKLLQKDHSLFVAEEKGLFKVIVPLLPTNVYAGIEK